MDNIFEFDRQKLTAYLLGQASDEETERFDEMSFSDSAFLEALNAAETDLIDDYVRGELSPTDRMTFEARYGGTSAIRQRLAFADAFAEFGQNIQPKNTFAEANAAAGVGSFETLWSRLFSKSVESSWFGLSGWGLAAAAVLCLVAIGGWLLAVQFGTDGRLAGSSPTTANLGNSDIIRESGNSEIQPIIDRSEEDIAELQDEKKELEREAERAADRARENVIDEERKRTGRASDIKPQARLLTLILTPQLRGSGKLPSVTLSSDEDRVSVRLELEPNDYNSYRIELRETGKTGVLWSNAKKSASDGANDLNVSIPARLLKGKNFTITVLGSKNESDPEIVGDYAFHVVR